MREVTSAEEGGMGEVVGIGAVAYERSYTCQRYSSYSFLLRLARYGRIYFVLLGCHLFSSIFLKERCCVSI